MTNKEKRELIELASQQNDDQFYIKFEDLMEKYIKSKKKPKRKSKTQTLLDLYNQGRLSAVSLYSVDDSEYYDIITFIYYHDDEDQTIEFLDYVYGASMYNDDYYKRWKYDPPKESYELDAILDNVSLVYLALKKHNLI